MPRMGETTMGLLGRLFLGRWFARWLLRGGPWSIALKLGGVALWGIWRWRREEKALKRQRRRLEIDADYEVVPQGELAEGGSRNPPSAPGYGGDNTTQANGGSIPFDLREETS